MFSRGFIEEGRKQQANFFNGIYLGILEGEWFAKYREQRKVNAANVNCKVLVSS